MDALWRARMGFGEIVTAHFGDFCFSFIFFSSLSFFLPYADYEMPGGELRSYKESTVVNTM